MLHHHLKLSLRRLWQNKTFSSINILGLVFGLAVFLLLLEFVAFEWSFNRSYSKAERTYRVILSPKQGGMVTYLPPAILPDARAQFPSIIGGTRVAPFVANGVVTLVDSTQQRAFGEGNTALVDGDFLELFDVPLVDGSRDLSQPYQLAMSASTAERYFGIDEAVGRQLQLNNQFGQAIYTVTAVYEDMPDNSDIRHDIVFSFASIATPEGRNGNEWADPSGWANNYVNAYFLLPDPEDAPAVEQSLTQLAATIAPEEGITAFLQPLTELHLGKSINDPLPTYGNRLFVLFLFGVALLILIIAWVNYINLSTAQALQQARNVGVRKVVGAKRGQLATHYLLETFLLTLVSAVLAVGLVEIAQQPFNQITGRDLSLSMLNQGWFLAVALAAILLGTLAAGSYVAFALTGFKPLETLRGTFSRSEKGVWMRKGLVVLQFTISIAFIAGTMVLYNQLQYLRQVDKGINLEQRLAIMGPNVGEDKSDRVQAFRNQLVQLPFVTDYCLSGGVPSTGYNFGADNITRLSPEPGDEKKSYQMLMIDDRYLSTYEIGLAAGSNFTPALVEKGWNEVDKIMLNEAAVRQLGFENVSSATGQLIKWGERQLEIVGVVKDYNHVSLHQTVKPTIFLPSQNSVYITVVLPPTNVSQHIAQLEQLYKATFPGNPFRPFFVDEEFETYYQSEQRTSKVFTAASVLAIFISCLGLFGLAVFAAEQRTKEIGIRKVLGASIANIVSLLSKDFIKLVLIALLLASPIAWYVMRQWLDNFAYQIELQWWMFALPGVLAIGIAFLTISVQGVKAAIANPVKSLRNE